jgi:hypothetical protein
VQDHQIGKGVAIGAEERHVQWFFIVPVMPLEPTAATTPDAASRATDQPQSLSKRRRIAGRSRTDAARAEGVEADLEVPTQASEQGVLAVPLLLFHGSRPVEKALESGRITGHDSAALA